MAAVTLPTLIANHKKQVTVTQLKKAYTEISQAIKHAELNSSELANWDFTLSGKDFYNTYLKDYFIKNKEIASKDLKQMYTIKNLNGTDCIWEVWCTKDDSFYVYLSDGSIMGVMTHGNLPKYKSITIDINGLDGPNKLGKDFFVFSIISPDGLVPYGFKNGGIAWGLPSAFERDVLISNAEYACNKESKGIWCSALILLDGWKISEDYPW